MEGRRIWVWKLGQLHSHQIWQNVLFGMILKYSWKTQKILLENLDFRNCEGVQKRLIKPCPVLKDLKRTAMLFRTNILFSFALVLTYYWILFQFHSWILFPDCLQTDAVGLRMGQEQQGHRKQPPGLPPLALRESTDALVGPLPGLLHGPRPRVLELQLHG